VFGRLIGNDAVKVTLRRLITTDRVPNSFLFAGDDGVGKRQFALEIAKSFLCIERTEEGGCGVCPSCERAAQFTIPERDDKNKDDFFSAIISTLGPWFITNG
jgi:DNA polymerase III gamma/tau subunit